jgi:HTH-type transcriptional regulator / antitoxin HigA
MLSSTKIIDCLALEIKEATPTPAAGRIYLSLVSAFPLVRIENRKQNDQALKVLERLMIYVNRNAAEIGDKDTVQIQQYLVCLGELISDFERKEFPINKPTPVEMIELLMLQHDLKQKDLADELGGQPVVSAILRGERELNTRQIRALAERFHVSPALFL